MKYCPRTTMQYLESTAAGGRWTCSGATGQEVLVWRVWLKTNLANGYDYVATASSPAAPHASTFDIPDADGVSR